MKIVRSKVDEKLIEKVKSIKKLGLSSSQIGKLVDVSKSTVANIINANYDFATYINLMSKKDAREKARKQEPTQQSILPVEDLREDVNDHILSCLREIRDTLKTLETLKRQQLLKYQESHAQSQNGRSWFK